MPVTPFFPRQFGYKRKSSPLPPEEPLVPYRDYTKPPGACAYLEKRDPVDPLAGADYSAMLAVIGAGDPFRGLGLLQAVVARLIHARAKHEKFAASPLEAAAMVGSECGELCEAVLRETPERQFDEALDIIATAIRFCGKEWGTEPGDGRP